MPTESIEIEIPSPNASSFQDTPTSPVISTARQGISRYYSMSRTLPVRTKKPRGWKVPTAYSISVSSASYPHGLFTTQDSSFYDRRMSNGCLGPRVTGDPVTNLPVPGFKGASDHGPLWWVVPATGPLKERAERQAYLKLKQQKVNLGVMAGEARKTAKHLGDSVLSLGNAAWAVKQRRFKDAMRHLGVDMPRRAPGKWLEWRYGWMPLLGDIHGSAEALADSHINPVGWQTAVKGIIREPWQRQGYSSVGAGRVWREESGMTGAFVRFDVEPENVFLATLGSLGLTNPLEIAWELLPLSFVIDWLVPVGDWLATLDAAYGYNFRSGSYTIRGEGTGTALSRPDNSGPVKSVVPSYTGRSTCRKLTLARNVYSGFPVPQYPRLRLGLNLNRFADGVSLLAQAFR